MTKDGRLSEILNALNDYEREGGDNIWQDVIYHLPEFDEAATDALGSSNRGDRIVLDLDDDDERVTISYDYPRARWVADR